MSRSIPSTVVARRFFNLARENNSPVTAHQLQKFTFLAHGWGFPLIDGQPLLAEPAEAWPRGPVYSDLYFALKKYENDDDVRDVPQSAKEWLGSKYGEILLTNKEENLIQDVYYAFGHLSGEELTILTHEEGAPWDKTVTNEEGEIDAHCQEIPNILIKDFYMQEYNRMHVT